MKLIDADGLNVYKAWVEVRTDDDTVIYSGKRKIVFADDIANAPTVDIDAITESHEKIGYDKGFRDGYAQSEVRHGRWLKNGDRYCECSVCHHEGNTSGADNYCWYCGAMMEEVEEDADK